MTSLRAFKPAGALAAWQLCATHLQSPDSSRHLLLPPARFFFPQSSQVVAISEELFEGDDEWFMDPKR
jgi:hypothetical protein